MAKICERYNICRGYKKLSQTSAYNKPDLTMNKHLPNEISALKSDHFNHKDNQKVNHLLYIITFYYS